MSIAEEGRSAPRPDGTGRPGERQSATDVGRLTDELVRQVADQVYAMLMADIALERERGRPASQITERTGGG